MASDKRRTDFLQQSSPGSSLPREPFAGREAFEPSDQTLESVLAGMSEKEKSGMKGYLALAEGPNPTLRSLMRGQDLAALGLNMNSDQPLMASYAGPFALPNAHPLRPLDNDFTTPDCYTVKKVAPLHTRINSFSDETLFYIFYSMPRDYMQVLVGQELMERKWRYHMREQMWMMRDENSQGYAYNDDRTSEQGYYIWWDKNQWKKIRRAYTLRYEDLDDLPSVGNRRVPQGMAGTANTGVNGGGAAGAGIFNAVPGLEKMAAAGRGF
jgi:CCR4-NOT transcription complex subunit 2